jgi:hypothetical protein
MSNYKDWEGAVPVNGNITPITRRPIEQIDSSTWEKLSTSELIDQRNALIERMNIARSMGNANMIATMQQGLMYIDALLQERESNGDGSRLV